MTLVDTAGLRETADTVEREGADRARVWQRPMWCSLWGTRDKDPWREDRAAAQAVRDRPVILGFEQDGFTGFQQTAETHGQDARADTDSRPFGERNGPFKRSCRFCLRTHQRRGWTGALRREALRLAGGGQEPLEPESFLTHAKNNRFANL